MPVSATKKSIQEGRPVFDITYHLTYYPEEIQKYCSVCRYGIFRSKHRIVSIIEDNDDAEEMILTPPINMSCPSCGTRYHISTII